MGGWDAGGRICAMNATVLDNKLNWPIRPSPLSFSFELSGENWGLASSKPARDSIPEGRSSNSSMGVSAPSQTSQSLGVGYSWCPVRYGYIHISFQGTLPFQRWSCQLPQYRWLLYSNWKPKSHVKSSNFTFSGFTNQRHPWWWYLFLKMEKWFKFLLYSNAPQGNLTL